MKIRHFATLGLVPALVAAGTGIAVAQVAGVTHAGAALTETGQLISGWSAKQSILGQAVYDASGERIGRALDLIVAPDRRVTFLIVEIGNFPSGSRHLVAVPASQLVVRGARLLLPDADRQALALQPAFVHAPITRTQSAIVEQALQDVDRAGGPSRGWSASLRSARAARPARTSKDRSSCCGRPRRRWSRRWPRWMPPMLIIGRPWRLRSARRRRGCAVRCATRRPEIGARHAAWA